jgi:hypothetical protein
MIDTCVIHATVFERVVYSPLNAGSRFAKKAASGTFHRTFTDPRYARSGGVHERFRDSTRTETLVSALAAEHPAGEPALAA